MLLDYLFCAGFILVSTVFPIWNDKRTKKQQVATKDSYVFAKGRVSVIAAMFSISRALIGIQALIGYPSELYYRGSPMYETLGGMVCAFIFVPFVFIPVFYNVNENSSITSIYQYLEQRFNSQAVRCMASLSFIIRSIFVLGVAVYMPCIILYTISGLSYFISVLCITGLVIIFTLLGGLKSAITADVIQGVLMAFVSMGFVIQGVYDAGDFSKVIDINSDNDRLTFFETNFDITARVDSLSAWIGGFFMTVSMLGTHQNIAQRYFSMKGLKEIRLSLLANIPYVSVFFTLPWLVAMVVFSSYYLCDPMKSGYTKKMDEILPLYVKDRMTYIPFVLGIFMATLFNGALSLAVSQVNALATTTWEDFLYQIPAFQKTADVKQLMAIKVLGVTFALINLGFVVIVALMPSVIDSAYIATSATSGPLVGIFILATLIPLANGKGAVVGMMSSYAVLALLITGSYLYPVPRTDLLATTTEGCTNTSFSSWITKIDGYDTSNMMFTNGLPIVETNRSLIETIANITYLYYGFIGATVCVIVAVVVSLLTRSKTEKCDKDLVHPFIAKHWL